MLNPDFMNDDDVERLADMIRDEWSPLVEDWKQRVMRVRSASDLDVPTLTDHLPEFLLELAESIRLVRGKDIQSALEGGTAPVHGLTRVRDGYSKIPACGWSGGPLSCGRWLRPCFMTSTRWPERSPPAW